MHTTMRGRVVGFTVTIAETAALAAPACAQPPDRASCLAQFVSVAAPAGDFGRTVSAEARHPELLGVERLGDFVSGFARAPAPCPVVP